MKRFALCGVLLATLAASASCTKGERNYDNGAGNANADTGGGGNGGLDSGGTATKSSTGGRSTKTTTGNNSAAGSSSNPTSGQGGGANGGASSVGGTSSSIGGATSGGATNATGGVTSGTGGTTNPGGTTVTGGASSTGGTTAKSTVPSGPVITTSSLPRGSIGAAYTTTLTATVTGSATWTLSTGSLPSGLALSTGGVISGTPTTDGTFTIVVAVLDGSGIKKTTTLTLTVVAVAKSIVAGYQHTCALMNNGHVKCWGANNWGQLGNGKTVASYTPVEVTGLATAEGITAEGDNTCARLTGGTAVCWGMSSPSSSGDGSTPVQISNLTNVIDMSTGCAVKSDGTVSCWGTRATLGSNQVFDTPTAISGFAGAVKNLSGSYSACAILGTNGAVQCWGGNYYGILGNNTTDNSITPVYPESFGVAALQISVGTRHVCAVLNGGSLACWGDNYYDEVGVSSSVVAKSLTPRGVQGLSGVVSVVAGDNVTCSVHTAGAVKCWGDNTCSSSDETPCGMLGDLSVKKSTTPMTVWSGTTPAKEAALGSEHGCLLAQGGSVYCWGLNSASQLGRDPNDTGYSQTPLKVTGI